MSRYSTFKYGAATYGASSTATLFWGLDVDWDDDGTLDSENEGERLIAVDILRGRDYLLTSGGDGFEPVRPGTATLVLNNYDGRYDTYNASSPLYPNVAPGRLMRLRVRSGSDTYTLFSGTIQDIQPSDFASEPTVTLICEDGLRWLQDVSATTDVYQSIYTDDAITTLLTAAQWPSIWGSDLNSGMDLLSYWWGKDRAVFDEIRALSDSELGRFFCNVDGALVFRNRQNAPASVATLDQSDMRKNVILSQPWEIQRNISSITANIISPAAMDVLWSYGSALSIGAGETITLYANFNSAAIGIIDPVATTDYQAFRNSDGTGTNYTSSIIIVPTIYSESVQLEITNTASRVAYLTLLQIRGSLLEIAPVSAKATSTGYTKRPRGIKFDLEWQQVSNNAPIFAEQLLTLLNAAPALPTFEIEARPDIQFGLDLFDPIDITMGRANIDATYRIGSIAHSWLSTNAEGSGNTGQAVLTTIKVEPHWAYDYWLFDSNAILGTSLLGW